jgi:hypothetical protein
MYQGGRLNVFTTDHCKSDFVSRELLLFCTLPIKYGTQDCGGSKSVCRHIDNDAVLQLPFKTQKNFIALENPVRCTGQDFIICLKMLFQESLHFTSQITALPSRLK